MSAPGLLTLIVARLEGVKPKANGGFTARCPGHDDRSTSLSIDVRDDGTILFKCFAGCEQGHVIERVCAIAGIDPRDLFAVQDGARHRSGRSPTHR